MIKQYWPIKNDYPDAILFYRMGDFYEMFFEDGRGGLPVLEITSPRAQERRVPGAHVRGAAPRRSGLTSRA